MYLVMPSRVVIEVQAPRTSCNDRLTALSPKFRHQDRVSVLPQYAPFESPIGRQEHWNGNRVGCGLLSARCDCCILVHTQ